MHGILKRAIKMYGLAINPAAAVEHLRKPGSCGIEVFSAEEVMALVRAAAGEQDAAIYLTTPKSGKGPLGAGAAGLGRWRCSASATS
jgi:hypothetical protein